MRLLTSAVFIGLFLPMLCFAKADRIQEIIIAGNQKTKSSVILNMTNLHIGEEITDKMLVDAKDRVSSSGLFEEVELKKKEGKSPGKVVLIFRVKEKMSWFVAPTLQFSTDALSGGFVFGESNLLGLNKKALVFADYGPSAKRAVIAYRDPSTFGTHVTLALDGIFRLDRMLEYEDRKEIRRVRLLDYGATLLPGYRWSPKFTSSIGVCFRNINQKLKGETKSLTRTTLQNGKDIAIVVRFVYDNTTNYQGLIHGAKIQFDTTLADNRYYSDFDYAKQEMRFNSGIVFDHKQYNWQNHMSIQLEQSAQLPYYREYTSGGTNLRGYVARQFRGDTKYGVGEEFYFPIHEFSRFLIRGVLFYDSNVIYFKDQEFSRNDWKNGVGGGLRFYMKGIVIPLIGYDVGWGIEDQTYASYLSIGAVF